MEPNEPEGFGPVQRVQLEEFFEEKGITVECPVCGGMEFDIGGLVPVPQVRRSESGMAPTGTAMIAVRVVCTNCSYILLFSARRMGLL
jgi:hypothetical protein